MSERRDRGFGDERLDVTVTEPCWKCGDKPTNGQEGYSAGALLLPGFRKKVWICGNCLMRAGA